MRKRLVPLSLAIICGVTVWTLVDCFRSIPGPSGPSSVAADRDHAGFRTVAPTVTPLRELDWFPRPGATDPVRPSVGEVPRMASATPPQDVALRLPKPEKVSTPDLTGSADAPAAPRTAWARFEVNKPQGVDFTMDEATRGRLTAREERDQLRDWLLFTVVNDAGLSNDEINRVLYDVPAVRHGHMRPVANFEYGETRSCYVGGGKVLTLIPRCAEAQWKDHLGHVADEYRKTLGEVPATVLVFEYQLRPENLTATVTRLRDIEGKQLFTKEYGYHEARVSSLEEFKAFMAEVQAVTWANGQGRGGFGEPRALTLGGRKLLGRSYRGLRVEDVAAVWQAQDKCKRQWKEHVEDVWDRFQREYGTIRYRTQEELERKQAEAKVAEEFVRRQIAEVIKRLGLTDHTGFSLDPDYDFDGLGKWFKTKEAGLKKLAEDKKAAVSAEEIAGAAKSIAERNEVPLLILLNKLKRSNGLAGGILAHFMNEEMAGFRFQKARYDGDLRGTEVGMILFYTDLLAKLWASIDLEGTLPRRLIEDFRSDVDGGNAPIYRAQTEMYPSTRLWFGPEERAYQIVSARKGVLFAQRATRIFSASSNPLQPGKEVPANYPSTRVMGWWNDHYEEVAQYEPEYERLNEYIKWSVIISWLFSEDQGEALRCLGGVEVKRDNWFPVWAKAKGDGLRFQFWDKIGFYPRGAKGCPTEAMPILASKNYRDFGEPKENWVTSGGVSGGRPSVLKERTLLPHDLQEQTKLTIRGADLKTLDRSGRTLTTTGGVKHEFVGRGTEQSTMKATAKEGEGLRSRYGELGSAELRRDVSHENGTLKVQTSAERAELGTLSVAPGENGFKVRFQSREIDRAQALVRDVSGQPGDPATLLARRPDVQAVVRDADGAHLVKLDGMDGWVKVRADATPPAELARGWHGRAADTGPGAKSYNYALVEPRSVHQELTAGEFLRVELHAGDGARQVSPVLARGPPDGKLPANARAVEVQHGPERFQGHLDAKGEVLYLKRADLGDLAERPHDLVRLLRGTDRSELSKPNAKLTLGTERPLVADGDALIQVRLKGDNAAAARLLAKDPVGGRRKVESWLAERQALIDRYLASGRHAEAEALAAEALRVGGPRPEVQLRQGLAKLMQGKAELVEAPRLLDAKPSAARQQLLNEINRRLAGPEMTAAERAGLATVGRQLVGLELQANGNTAAKVGLKPNRGLGRPALEAEFVKPPRSEPAKAADVGKNAQLYVDDAAGLNNRELAGPSRQATLQQALEADSTLQLVKLYQPHPTRARQADPILKTQPDVVHCPHPSTSKALTLYRASSLPYLKRHHRSVWPPPYLEEERRVRRLRLLGLTGGSGPPPNPDEDYDEDEEDEKPADTKQPKKTPTPPGVFALIKKAQP